MGVPELAISVVNWNTASLLRACLASVFQNPPSVPFQVLVVDNHSQDGSPEMVRREFPRVRLLRSLRNRGYAGGHNWALRATASPYLLLLNSDILVHPGSIDRLLDFLRSHPEAGIVGPRLLYPDGRVQPSCTQEMTLWSVFCQQAGLDRLFPSSWLLGGYWRLGLEAQEPLAVPQLSGAAWLLRREVVEQIGELDEGYGMYCEDTDYCLRARRAGWKVYYLPQATMTHAHGASAQQAGAEMIAFHGHACVRYFRKHEGLGKAFLVRGMVLGGAALRWGLWSLAALGGGGWARRQVRLFGRVWHLLRQPHPPPLPEEAPCASPR